MVVRMTIPSACELAQRPACWSEALQLLNRVFPVVQPAVVVSNYLFDMSREELREVGCYRGRGSPRCKIRQCDEMLPYLVHGAALVDQAIEVFLHIPGNLEPVYYGSSSEKPLEGAQSLIC